MSRIAKKNILVPDNINVILKKNKITIKSQHNSISYNFNNFVIIQYHNNMLSFISKVNKNFGWMQAGTVRSLVNSMIIGITTGFTKKLQLFGVGYRFSIEKNNILNMNVGYSHIIRYNIPKDVNIKLISTTEIILQSFNKQLLGQVAANIRNKRKPEVYKGKGVRYFHEKIRIKEAKKK